MRLGRRKSEKNYGAKIEEEERSKHQGWTATLNGPASTANIQTSGTAKAKGYVEPKQQHRTIPQLW